MTVTGIVCIYLLQGLPIQSPLAINNYRYVHCQECYCFDIERFGLQPFVHKRFRAELVLSKSESFFLFCSEKELVSLSSLPNVFHSLKNI